MKNISFDFSQEEDPEAIDTVDVDARKNFKVKQMPEVESPVKDRTLGFDLMSLTSRRGHYVDHVRIVAIVVRIDMDLLKQVLIYVKMRLITRTATIFQFLGTRRKAYRVQKLLNSGFEFSSSILSLSAQKSCEKNHAIGKTM